MTKTNTFEIFINTCTARVAVIEAASICAAYDRAFDLFPTVNYANFIVIPTTIERVMGGAR